MIITQIVVLRFSLEAVVIAFYTQRVLPYQKLNIDEKN